MNKAMMIIVRTYCTCTLSSLRVRTSRVRALLLRSTHPKREKVVCKLHRANFILQDLILHNRHPTEMIYDIVHLSY